MKHGLKPSGTKRLKVKCDILLSNYASKFNLRRYSLLTQEVNAIAAAAAAAAADTATAAAAAAADNAAAAAATAADTAAAVAAAAASTAATEHSAVETTAAGAVVGRCRLTPSNPR